MPSLHLQSPVNRRLFARANQVLLEQVRSVFSLKLRGDRFRSAVQAEEGVEVAGLDVYDLEAPPEQMDLSRLAVPWALLPLALVNQDVLARRYEATVENEFIAVLDLSRSMRYPLRRLYAGQPLDHNDFADPLQGVLTAKPSLLKVTAGALLRVAAASGFRTRVVTFGGRGIRDSGPLRRADPAALFEEIDQAFAAVTAAPTVEPHLYDRVLAQLWSRKGVFLFVGDFLDAVPTWDDPAARRRWADTLGMFAEFGRRRPFLSVRVVHPDDARRPETLERTGWMPRSGRDRCDIRVEDEADESGWDDVREDRKAGVKRLRRQQSWAAVLEPALRRSCRGFVTVGHTRDMARDLQGLWDRLAERRR
jgi:hypothetical protein